MEKDGLWRKPGYGVSRVTKDAESCRRPPAGTEASQVTKNAGSCLRPPADTVAGRVMSGLLPVLYQPGYVSSSWAYGVMIPPTVAPRVTRTAGLACFSFSFKLYFK